jgi:hypothetical protein
MILIILVKDVEFWNCPFARRQLSKGQGVQTHATVTKVGYFLEPGKIIAKPSAYMEAKEQTWIGIMTCGGDCPGLNPVIRAYVCCYHSSFPRATLTAIKKYNWRVLGIEDSMQGLINLECVVT